MEVVGSKKKIFNLRHPLVTIQAIFELRRGSLNLADKYSQDFFHRLHYSTRTRSSSSRTKCFIQFASTPSGILRHPPVPPDPPSFRVHRGDEPKRGILLYPCTRTSTEPSENLKTPSGHPPDPPVDRRPPDHHGDSSWDPMVLSRTIEPPAHSLVWFKTSQLLFKKLLTYCSTFLPFSDDKFNCQHPLELRNYLLHTYNKPYSI